jgi:hypothetical protein
MGYTKELREAIAHVQQLLEELEKPKPKQWEPRGGEHYVNCLGGFRHSTSSYGSRVFGTERRTKEALEKARDAMRTHNRLLAYVDEFGGDWVADWNDRGQFKHYVLYSIPEQKYSHQGVCLGRHIGAVYMSLECAESLIAKLESGEVVL